MGKGQRNKAVGEEVRKAPKPLKDWQIRERNKKRTKIVFIAILVLIAALAVCFIFINAANKAKIESGDELRSNIVLSSDNYEVNGAMMAYYYYTSYINEMNSYGNAYVSYYGLDTSKSLKDQKYPAGEGESWYDHFMSTALDTAEYTLHVAEAAKAEGKIDEDKISETIDEAIKGITEAAEKQDLSVDEYLKKSVCPGVKESDVRDCLNITARAQQYYESFESGLVYTDEDCEKYYNDNKSDFLNADYVKYQFAADIPKVDGENKEPSKDILDKAYAEAKEKAEALAENKTKEEFISAISGILKESLTDPTSEDSNTEIASKLRSAEGTVVKSTGNELSGWAFADGREVGDTTVIDDGNGKYTAYLLTATAYRKENETVSVRHILLSTEDYKSAEGAKKEADNVYKQWQDGDKTEDSFAELAKKYSSDSTSVNGGLIEGITPGQMVTNFNDWCFDESRKAGDTGVVETEYGAHVMYFVGKGDVEWIYDAKAALKSADIEAFDKKCEETYPVAEHKDLAPDIYAQYEKANEL